MGVTGDRSERGSRRIWGIPEPTSPTPGTHGGSQRRSGEPALRAPEPPTISAPSPPSRIRSGDPGKLYVGPYDDADRYQLDDLRTKGGEAVLWLATLDVDGLRLPVAIKVMLPEYAGDIDGWRIRWQRQAEILRSCDHPGLVRVRDVFEGPTAHPFGERPRGRSLYLVMNWVEGESLQQRTDDGPLEVGQVLPAAAQVAAALDYLHSGALPGSSVLHRDVKPSNIILGPNGATLVDFGFTCVQSDSAMALLGTPPFLAPELSLTGRYSSATDRYAFAATIFNALVGAAPIAGPPQAVLAMVHDRLVQLPEFRRNRAAVDLFVAMLDPDPDRRPESCLQWIRSLQASTVHEGDVTVFNPQRRR